jgi:thiol-disulfide isomerase/thioredoxin
MPARPFMPAALLAVLGWIAAGAFAMAQPPATAGAFFDATLLALDGSQWAAERLRGKPLVVNFWARWCAPCRDEIPELVALQTRHGSDGLVVVGVGLEHEAQKVREFARAYQMDYLVLLAGDQGVELMRALGNLRAGLPYTVAIGRDGQVIAKKLGPARRDELEAFATRALAGR